MAKQPRVLMSNDEVAPRDTHWMHVERTTSLSADASFYFVAPFTGKIVSKDDVVAHFGETGAGNTLVAINVHINGVSIWTTAPSIAAAAADGSATVDSGAGIVQGVIDEAKNSFDKGDLIRVILDRTAGTSNADDIRVAVGLTPLQDKEPDIRIPINS